MPGDEITQKQFYETMALTKKEIIGAVDKVYDGVIENKVEIGKVQTKQVAQEKFIKQNTNDIKTLREQARTNLLKAAGSGGVVGTLATIILRLIEGILGG